MASVTARRERGVAAFGRHWRAFQNVGMVGGSAGVGEPA